MVIGNISQSRNWVNQSARGVKTKSNKKTWRLIFRWKLKKNEFWNAQTGGERWITFILTFSDFCLQHFQLPLPVICFKNVHYRRRSFRNNLKNAARNSNYHKKSTSSRVQQSMFMLLYALFISFPVRHTANFRFDGCHCIGDLVANAMVRKLLYSAFDR